jgi:2-methylcitrate dehydratase PrpD
MGAAAAAALLAGLGEQGVLHALGVTASFASGVIEANRTGGTVKRLHCGWAAQSAVTAAGLVRRGFTGPPTVLEGRFGFFQAFLRDQTDLDQVADRLGEDWAVPGIFFKPYPANHFTHTAIDAGAELRAQGVPADDGAIESIELRVPTAVIRTIGQPIETKRAPETGYQAQFSGPYAVVTGLLGGSGLGAGLADFTDALAADPRRRALMAKVTVTGDPRCDAIFPNQFPAIVTVRGTDGREWTAEVLANRGGPQRPLTEAELAAKFADNVAGRLTPAAAATARELALTLDSVADLGALLRPLTRLETPGDDHD